MTSGGPDYYPRSKSKPSGLMVQGGAAAGGAPASQSRRNIQVKVKRKKQGVDRAMVASHDFQNGGLGTSKLLGFAMPIQQNMAQAQRQASGALVGSVRDSAGPANTTNQHHTVTTPNASVANAASALSTGAAGS